MGYLCRMSTPTTRKGTPLLALGAIGVVFGYFPARRAARGRTPPLWSRASPGRPPSGYRTLAGSAAWAAPAKKPDLLHPLNQPLPL